MQPAIPAFWVSPPAPEAPCTRASTRATVASATNNGRRCLNSMIVCFGPAIGGRSARFTRLPVYQRYGREMPGFTDWPVLRSALRLGRQALGPNALGQVLVRVVAGAHQGAAGDRLESQLVGRSLKRLELLGVPVANHREVVLGRPQVLAHGQDLDAVLA